MTIQEMLEKRAKLIADARAIVDAAEGRSLNDEESTKFDAMMADGDKIKAEAARLQRLEDDERSLTESAGRQAGNQRDDNPNKPGDVKPEMRSIELRDSHGMKRSVVWQHTADVDKHESEFRSYLISGQASAELRALQKDVDSAGGFLSPSQQWMGELIKAKDNQVFMRQLCRVLPPLTSSESLGTPSLDNDPADPTWVSELSIGSEDSTLDFGKRELSPHPLAQFIKVSKTLLRRSAISADVIVRDRLAYKQSVVEENAFLNGTGANQPLGVFTASNDGIPTGRDISTGNTTTEIKADGLIECVYNLPAQYRNSPSNAWIFHRDAVKAIRKLKDGEGNYLWSRSLTAGEPDRILNYPLHESEYAPNTFTTGLYVGLFGDFSNYWIVDALTMSIQVLVELYAATNQNGYIIRSETDGAPTSSAAFSRLALA
jgi:HK97 family phage major capsid protein